MIEARLGDVVVSMKNGLYKPASEYADDGTPCLRMYNIETGSIVWRDIKRMRVSAAELEEYGLREGDLLVNRVNSRELVGKAAFIPASLEPSVFESKNIRVRLDASKVLPKFINYQLLAGSRRYFAGNAQQVVGMASISQKQLADFPIVLAELDQQRRIVAEIEKQFSRLDEAVANLKRVKANLKRYEEATIRDASVAARRDSPIRLASELFSWSSGVNLPASKQHGGSVPVYGGNGITGYHSKGNISKVTVVIGRVGAGCGNVHLVREPAWITDNAIYAARVADAIFLPYAALMIRAANLNSGAAGSGQPFVNQRMLNEVQVPLPSLDEQRRIVAEVDRRLSIVREVEAEADANLQRAQTLRLATLAKVLAPQM